MSYYYHIHAVNLQLKHSVQTTSINYEYNCSFGIDLESSMQFVTKLQGSSSDQDSGLQTCSNGKATGVYGGLSCSSTYNLTAYFVHPSGNLSDCPVTNVEGIELTTTMSCTDFKCQCKSSF